ncbi:MAG TPA: hypothetical protein VMM18_17990 [Gemmatimonadaceae bacterium]|nr:hypothetical protein [Gemmatimonadaceae bacterium]
MLRRTIPLFACSLLLLEACGGASRPAAEQSATPPPPSHPLAAFVGQQLVILPVRYFAPMDSLGWGEQVEDQAAYLRELDREIAFALGEREITTNWVLAEALATTARRNPASMPNPHLLAANRIRRGRLQTGSMVAEPLSSQLRALTALGDARNAIYPVDLRFENAPGGARPVLRVVLIDTRSAMLRFVTEVAGEPRASFSPALLVNVAERFADLFAAP